MGARRCAGRDGAGLRATWLVLWGARRNRAWVLGDARRVWARVARREARPGPCACRAVVGTACLLASRPALVEERRFGVSVLLRMSGRVCKRTRGAKRG